MGIYMHPTRSPTGCPLACTFNQGVSPLDLKYPASLVESCGVFFGRHNVNNVSSTCMSYHDSSSLVNLCTMYPPSPPLLTMWFLRAIRTPVYGKKTLSQWDTTVKIVHVGFAEQKVCIYVHMAKATNGE